MSSKFSKKWLIKIASAFEISKEKNRDGLPILVEGKRDKDFLLELGFSGTIEVLNRGWSLEKLAIYLLEKNQVISENKKPILSLLMDWDRTGEKLQKKLVQIFSSMDEIVDETLRNELIRTLNGRTKTVEGIRFILSELQELMD
ncbi:MAG: hypothetical protein CL983_00240 [Euryarchaeota archaeon]|nr:hypothetical protein [Euryarchaeota archaeon]|tara:strand:+ start:4022 stop:4453 length:432 start_codon:yes stop_codon:yes gene_type:complete